MAEYGGRGLVYDKETEKKIEIIAHNIATAKDFIGEAEKKVFAEDMITDLLRASTFFTRAIDVAKTIDVNSLKIMRERAKVEKVLI